MGSIGERLKEERQRLGLSQPAFGELASVTKKTQLLYEGGERSPDAVYLAALSRAGVDVLYVLVGKRSDEASLQGLSAQESALLDLYRGATKDVRKAVLGALVGAGGPGGTVLTNTGAGAVQIAQTKGRMNVGNIGDAPKPKTGDKRHPNN